MGRLQDLPAVPSISDMPFSHLAFAIAHVMHLSNPQPQTGLTKKTAAAAPLVACRRRGQISAYKAYSRIKLYRTFIHGQTPPVRADVGWEMRALSTLAQLRLPLSGSGKSRRPVGSLPISGLANR
jgi:hypothetical protein